MKRAQTFFTGAHETKTLDPGPQGQDGPGCWGKAGLRLLFGLMAPPSLASTPGMLDPLVTSPNIGDHQVTGPLDGTCTCGLTA